MYLQARPRIWTRDGWEKSSKWPEQDLNLGLLDCEFKVQCTGHSAMLLPNQSLFVLKHVNDFSYWDLIFLKMFSEKEVHHEKILLWFLFCFEDLNPHQHLGLSISEVYPLMCKLVRYWQLTCVMGLFLLVCLMNCWLHCFNCVLLVFNRQRGPLTVCKAMSARVKFWWATWPLDSWNGNKWHNIMCWNYEKPLRCILSFSFCFLVRHTKNNNNSPEQNLT